MIEKILSTDHQKFFIAIGASMMFLSVALGAFGAHFLKERLDQSTLAIFEVGVRYQHYHALGLLIIGILYGMFPSTYLAISFWSIFIGIIIFSGSLYLLCATAVKVWGAITPIGGLLFLAGWFFLALGMIKN